MPTPKKELTKNQVAILSAIITSTALIVVALITGFFSSNNKQQPVTSPVTVNPVISPVFNNQIKPTVDNSKKERVKSAPKTINAKNVNTGVNNGIIGDNGVQNYGIQPRIISDTSEIIRYIFSNFPDKSTHFGFVAPSEEGEILNVKNQIVKTLKAKGYFDVEEINGIRLIIGSELPVDRISLIKNTSSSGGISFFIPPIPMTEK